MKNHFFLSGLSIIQYIIWVDKITAEVMLAAVKRMPAARQCQCSVVEACRMLMLVLLVADVNTVEGILSLISEGLGALQPARRVSQPQGTCQGGI